MEVGIREAKNSLSKLLDAVRHGEEVFVTNRGERVAQIVPARAPSKPNRGRGIWKGKLKPGWDSPKLDKEIEEMFEFLSEPDRD
jgi:prevent-host-death family protein